MDDADDDLTGVDHVRVRLGGGGDPPGATEQGAHPDVRARRRDVGSEVKVDNVRFTDRAARARRSTAARLRRSAAASTAPSQRTSRLHDQRHRPGLPLIGVGASDVNAFHTQLLAAINAAKALPRRRRPTARRADGAPDAVRRRHRHGRVERHDRGRVRVALRLQGAEQACERPDRSRRRHSGLGVSPDVQCSRSPVSPRSRPGSPSRAPGTAVFTLRPSELTLGVAVDIQDLDAPLKVGFLSRPAVANGRRC